MSRKIVTVARPLWRDRRLGAVAALALGLALGALVGWLTPRGPLTSAEGLATMGLSLGVGLAAGFAMRSRWAMLAAPAGFVLAFELARIGLSGPTVDGIHLSPYGLIAFVTGRGVVGLVVIFPLVLGATFGAAAARRAEGDRGAEPPRGRRRVGLYARRAVASFSGLLLLLLAVAIARPAGTDAISGSEDGIAELTSVDVNGHELAMMIRGHSAESPVLLFLAGGPGGSELGAMRNHLEALEDDFVVATWDQRGAGKSYGEIDPTSTLTMEGVVDDTVEVTDYLRERFGRERIYLMGQSWGSILGVLAVQREPELYEAYIGTGQMVSPAETDRIFYEDTLRWARRRGDDALVDTLTENGPPPYDDILDYEPALSHEHDVYPYDHETNSEGEGGFSENLFVGEYTLLEQLHALGAFIDTFSVLYPQLQNVDLRRSVTELDVPVYLIQGRHEARARAIPARQWFRRLKAPRKRMVILGTSGHRPPFEQPEQFTFAVREAVLEGQR